MCEILVRCDGIKACNEVVDRLRAADRVRLLEVDDELADRIAKVLRAQAQKFADIHREELAHR